jgi:hypothetical protein
MNMRSSGLHGMTCTGQVSHPSGTTHDFAGDAEIVVSGADFESIRTENVSVTWQ